ncbi:catalase family protein [Massilia forsythiae]|uniref:Catalase family protein n=1 Tax=Massilia forsythiae TaxID=2728020 RepID=A0A7Z2W0Q3_9BURK|nr:catalase family protein [Massilia forsythiae]QJE02347.1 catalase family protein [Massilia forsythiae]
MNAPTSIDPIPYQPSFEVPEDDETETTFDLKDTMRGISVKTFEDSGTAIRSVHAKSHGLLLGQLTVLDNLPPVYAQGLFAQPGSYPVVMRLSTTPGDILSDDVSTPRGMSLKVVGVPGARVEGSEGDTTQDFVMVNGPVFNSATAKKFLGNLKLLAATTDKAPNVKRAFSAVLRGAEKALEAVGGESVTLKSMGGHPETNPLGETYFTQVPILFGQYMAKVSLAPVAPSLTALTDAPVDLKDKPDGLRDAVVDYFAAQGGEWELRVQLCTDIDKMPIEDASVEWKEEESPYVTVARLRAEPQPAYSDERARRIDQGMQFSPWHALAAHRPLGSIMRVRKTVYEMSQRFRAERNGVAVTEPTDVDFLRNG